MSHQYKEVFLSYSHIDSEIADFLCDFLKKLNIQCWKDDNGIELSEYHREIIAPAIRHAKIFLLVLSKSSQMSEEVKDEYHLARKNHLRIISIKIDDEPLTDAFDHIDRFQMVMAYPSLSQNHLRQLVQGIHHTLHSPTDYIDRRLQNSLESAGVKYSIQEDGSFLSLWNFANQEEPDAAIFFEPLKESDDTVIVKGVMGFSDISTEKLKEFVLENWGPSKGEWAMRNHGNGIALSHVIYSNYEELRSACSVIIDCFNGIVNLVNSGAKKESSFWDDVGDAIGDVLKGIGVGVGVGVGAAAIMGISSLIGGDDDDDEVNER